MDVRLIGRIPIVIPGVGLPVLGEKSDVKVIEPKAAVLRPRPSANDRYAIRDHARLLPFCLGIVDHGSG